MTEISPVLARMLDCLESERIEFKEAKRGFEKNQLFKYCVALSNEGGGHLVLGVTDRLPRQIVGTRAFGDLDELCNAIYNALRFEVQVREEFDPQGRRVLVLSIPGRPAGSARSYDSAFWCRRGGSLVGMGPERLQAIFSTATACLPRSFQVGLVRRDIPAFREEVFREGLLNAVCHRDYRRTESVFVRQYPQRIDIDSPGGLPRRLPVDNLMFKSSWRNRRIAEALEKTDLVERSGQGIDRKRAKLGNS